MLAGTMAFSIAAFKTNDAKAETKLYVTATDKVRLRRDSNTDGDIITTLRPGDTLEAVQLLGNGWYEVLYGNEYAYVCGDYVSAFTMEEEEKPKIVVANTGVRIRSTNSTEGDILGSLGRGDSLEYVGTTSNNWHEVIYGGRHAYISGDYSSIQDEGIKRESVLVVTAKDDVRVRAGSNTDADIYTVLKKGKSLQVVRKLDNGWYEVVYNNRTAYVMGKYVKEEMKSIVTNKVYKLVSATKDTTIYSDRALTRPIGTLPENELGNVYYGIDDTYLITSEAGDGYIRRSDTKSLGDSVVVVDVSSQTMSYYDNCDMVLTGATVTGKNSTPTEYGVYSIYSKERGKYLMGEYYVEYWMPFNGGQGLHDAQWRKKFGGTIYKNSGSHGCVNLPLDLAGKLYDKVSVDSKDHPGTKVLIKR